MATDSHPLSRPLHFAPPGAAQAGQAAPLRCEVANKPCKHRDVSLWTRQGTVTVTGNSNPGRNPFVTGNLKQCVLQSQCQGNHIIISDDSHTVTSQPWPAPGTVPVTVATVTKTLACTGYQSNVHVTNLNSSETDSDSETR